MCVCQNVTVENQNSKDVSTNEVEAMSENNALFKDAAEGKDVKSRILKFYMGWKSPGGRLWNSYGGRIITRVNQEEDSKTAFINQVHENTILELHLYGWDY